MFGSVPQNHELTGVNGQESVGTPVLARKLDLEHVVIVGHDDHPHLPPSQKKRSRGLQMLGRDVLQERYDIMQSNRTAHGDTI